MAAASPASIAIVGSGPSGFYAAEALLKSATAVRIDVIERLPCPFGLVRSGVAPDHAKLKNAIKVYEQIASHPQFSFLGNVRVGSDVSVEELREHYHAVVLCCGAESDRRLGIPGEELPGSHTATEFVGWYNGHPDYRDLNFDLSHETAVIIGQGNVAADVARILAKTEAELASTDIAAHALEVLATSRVREIHVIGRRGPAQAKFTSKELKEFAELADCAPWIDPSELELDPASAAEVTDRSNPGGARNVEIFRAFATVRDPPKGRTCRFRFLRSPVELRGSDRLEAIVLERNRLEGEPFAQSARGTGSRETLDCDLLFRSIGYRGVPMPGVPFDERHGVFPNVAGRVVAAANEPPLPGLYTAGWIKRGPSGIIGTNRADAVETVECLLSDLPRLVSRSCAGGDALRALLGGRGVRVVDFDDWLRIDAEERRRGVAVGKPREKLTRIAEMLAVIA